MSEPKALTVQSYLKDSNVQLRIHELLRSRASQFTTSLLSAINANHTLAECKPETVVNAALTAASMDLPINPNLGFAYIIPYKNRGKYEAQFQMGYKGFIQLAQRSGQYKTIGSTTVYEGQLVSEDPLRGHTFNWKSKKSDKVIGYVALFVLLNGFEKSMYMDAEEMEEHAKKYSQTYKKNIGMWADDFETMALKTVLKLLLSKFGILSTELQKALQYDQAIVTDTGAVYVDNELNNVGADADKKAEIVAAHKNGDKESQGDNTPPDTTG